MSSSAVVIRKMTRLWLRELKCAILQAAVCQKRQADVLIHRYIDALNILSCWQFNLCNTLSREWQVQTGHDRSRFLWALPGTVGIDEILIKYACPCLVNNALKFGWPPIDTSDVRSDKLEYMDSCCLAVICFLQNDHESFINSIHKEWSE